MHDLPPGFYYQGITVLLLLLTCIFHIDASKDRIILDFS